MDTEQIFNSELCNSLVSGADKVTHFAFSWFKVMSACRQFILNFVKKMHKTIPYKLLKSLSCLDTGGFSSITVNDIKHLHETFHSPDVDIDNLARDTRKLLCNPPRLDLGVVEFWTHVCRMFPDSFGLFLPKILCLPNSNASTERVFSLLKAVHTPVRNSLKLETINGILSLKVNKTTPIDVNDADAKLRKECKSATFQYNTGLAQHRESASMD